MARWEVRMETPYDVARSLRLLTVALGRADSARALYEDAGSLGAVLETPGERLYLAYGVPAANAEAWDALRWLRVEAAEMAAVRAGPLTSPELVFEALRGLFDGARHERFFVVPVDVLLRPTCRPVLVCEGAPDCVPIATRRLFEILLREKAAGAFIVHNHPSGDPTPSAQDRRATRRLCELAEALGLRIYDHLVVAGPRAFSIAQGLRVGLPPLGGAQTEAAPYPVEPAGAACPPL